MGLSPRDDPKTRTSHGRADEIRVREPSSLSRRQRLRALAVGFQRGLVRLGRKGLSAVRNGVNRLLSPGRATPSESLADHTVDTFQCPEVGDLPPRAFPIVSPTRSFQLVEDDVDLTGSVEDDVLTVTHPDGDEAWIETDTWTRIRP